MGLLGGVHCFGMCGGIVSAVSVRPAGASLGAQLSYNAGRLLSYSAAGAIAGAFGAIGMGSSPVVPAQIVLFVVANALVILLGLHIAGWGTLVLRLEAVGAALWRRIAPLGRRFLPADTPSKALALGALWGWLPCGLVYSALALSLLAATPLRGALVMFAFGLGTLPNLLAAGLLAQRIRPALRRAWVRMLAGTLIVMLGLVGFARIPGLTESIQNGLACIG
ncbi:MAG: sulfite exporter TauE/SafE family protein [Betaproteobacteria bacterium]|nr:sulfite exporter TauE/SafE family protein [Betaproteobacteria bacterium]